MVMYIGEAKWDPYRTRTYASVYGKHGGTEGWNLVTRTLGLDMFMHVQANVDDFNFVTRITEPGLRYTNLMEFLR